MRLLTVFLCSILVSSVAFGQSARQSELTITVLDPTEQSVPGASVTIEQNGVTKQTLVTDGNGQVMAASLAPGSYQIKAALEGFTDSEPTRVRVAGNQPTKL